MATGILTGMAETDQEYKVRENRLRRMADRQGLALKKCPRRDPRAIGHGTYMLVDASTRAVVAMGFSDGYGLNLDEIERELTRESHSEQYTAASPSHEARGSDPYSSPESTPALRLGKDT
jgi:hypothetical protein